MTYQVIKALHMVAAFAWMAGLFYLPRLFVYHADAKPGSEVSETLKVMERRLLRAIMNPAMIAVWAFGLWLAYDAGVWKDYWFLVKFAAVLLLSAFHHALALWRKDFAADRNTRSGPFYRVVNEFPTVLLIVIVFMVVLRPF